MKNLSTQIGMIFLGLMAIPSEGYSWGLHYLVTDRALPGNTFSESIPVEPLEKFLADQKLGVATVFADYYTWLESKKSKRFLRARFDVSQPTASNFLKAARLNPNVIFYEVDRVMPNEKLQGLSVPYEALSPYEKPEKHFTFLFRDIAHETVSAKSILRTYSDEPDWWIDGDLWDIPEYGYGKIPYGREKRLNGAAFHTLFSHEPWIVRKLVPELTEGMALDRVEMMTQLSRLAFLSGHPYWGYRFAAWGLHYIEDLSQPYHSKAVPSANWFYYVRYIFSSDKVKFKKDATQLISNRHLLYEDFVKTALQDSYLNEEKTDQTQILAQALASQTFQLPKKSLESVESLVEEVTQVSADQARGLDESVATAYGPRMTEDPTYDLDQDQNYDSQAVFKSARPEVIASLIQQTQKNFNLTGAAIRAYIQLCQPRRQSQTKTTEKKITQKKDDQKERISRLTDTTD